VLSSPELVLTHIGALLALAVRLGRDLNRLLRQFKARA
jgi:hypothetical protein